MQYDLEIVAKIVIEFETGTELGTEIRIKITAETGTQTGTKIFPLQKLILPTLVKAWGKIWETI